MIKLVNVSKYYHDENSVVMGLRKVNVEFKLGEFVAITGESGSGKSTLLNVISGIDTYEDGELYINEKETSYYSNVEWEEYRKNNIGFIFQNYNLVDSYTVLENVETAMIIQGIKRKERIKRAKDIIERVGLTPFIKNKATKLSGGQKQRLAIARALAKETKIIVADEPTGNLDSNSGKEIIELLYEISKEKLVIIVTHNYEEVKEYVTRKIRLFDGEIIEDREIKPYTEVTPKETSSDINNMSFFQKSFTFALYNLKGQPKRSIFLLLITLTMTLFIMIFCIGYGLTDSLIGEGKTNTVFRNNYPERVVVVKKDGTEILNSDLDKILDINHVDSIIKYDELLDLMFTSYGDLSILGSPNSASLLTKEDVLYGRLPQSDDEVILYMDIEEEVFENNIEGRYFELMERNNTKEYKVCGISRKQIGISSEEIFFTENELKNLAEDIFLRKQLERFTIVTEIMDNIAYSNGNDYFMGVVKLDELPNNTVAFNKISYDLSSINVSALMDNEELVCEEITNYLKTYKEGCLYVSSDVYENFDSYKNSQISLNLDKVTSLEEVQLKLDELGFYSTSPSKTSLDTLYLARVFVKIFFLCVIGINVFLIYLVGYLVIKTILINKKKDYTILRSIGIDTKTITLMSKIEIIFSFLLSFIIVLIALIIIKVSASNTGLQKALDLIKPTTILLLALVNVILSLLVSRKFNKLLMKKSLLVNMKED